MSSIENTLEERGGRYGSFEHHAAIAQDLQDVMRKQAGWARLAPDQRQALTVIADKIARMLNGDAAYRDNWHDIVGYAKLVDDRMARDEPKPPIGVPPATPDLPAIESEYGMPPKPEGPRWRDFSKAPPRNMDEVVEAVLINGNSVTRPADQLTWDSSLSVGVAWWRYPL